MKTVDIQKLNKSVRLNDWAQMVRQCRNSGMTVSAWCAENGINPKTYYYRFKRVCEAIPKELKPGKLPMPQETKKTVFAEVAPIRRSANAAITVQFNGAEIQICNGADAETIEVALLALSKIC